MIRNIDGFENQDSNMRKRVPPSKPLFVKEKAPILKILLDAILCVEAFGSYVSIKTFQDRHTVHATMKEIEEMLPEAKFIRVHRSYIVAIDKINAINNKTLEVGKKLIPVSDSFRKELMKRMD